MYFNFDKPVASQVYYHADQKEAWRADELPKYGLYDAELTKVGVNVAKLISQTNKKAKK